MSELLQARTRRAERETKVELSDGTHVIARKEDMTALVFDGRLPMPLLTAVQKMIEMPAASNVERVAALGENAKSLLTVLREHVVNVVISPKLVMVETDDLDALPVTYLDLPDLMAIWAKTAIVPRVGPAAAASFRQSGSVDAPASAPSGDPVQATTQQLASEPDREVVSG